MNESKSQNDAILQYLQRGGKVTSLSALSLFGCLRLSGRAFDLRRAGFDVRDRWIETTSGKRVKEYYIPDVRQPELFT